MLLLKNTEAKDGSVVWAFQCPGCGNSHTFTVGGTNPGKEPRWKFNDNLDKPTFTPSLRCIRREGPDMVTTCHLNVTDGMIVYHGDCPHVYKNRTVPMEPYDAQPAAAEADPVDPAPPAVPAAPPVAAPAADDVGGDGVDAAGPGEQPAAADDAVTTSPVPPKPNVGRLTPDGLPCHRWGA